jgi:hypothetical protein
VHVASPSATFHVNHWGRVLAERGGKSLPADDGRGGAEPRAPARPFPG